FQDPSVTQLTNTSQSGLDEFNPFSESSQLTNAARTTPATQPSGHSQPAVLQTSVEPTPQAVAAAAQAGLLQQQAELERKAAELEKKERELQSNAASINPRQNNWPPLPKKCPIKPCFYQDFSADIPADYQRICKMLYYLWMLHSITLLLNLLACLAWFTVQAQRGVDFGLSILWFILFTPCAFLCWYRPIYKAFRQVLFASVTGIYLLAGGALVLTGLIIYCLQDFSSSSHREIDQTHFGWIAALSELHENLAVAVIMMVVAAFFTLCAVLSLLLLKQVHSLYRRTGASFQRAQEEFSQGILTNRSFQNAAAGAASSAAQSA
ncbi:Secretory carrier-associated membrane protein 2, partial [Tauraco erythrolophus]